MHIHNEDLELQIRLAELQADVQIFLTAGFAFLAGFVTIMIGFEQIYFVLPPDSALVKILIITIITSAGVACFFIVVFFFRKVLRIKEQMGELRKEYVW